jgi:hypothetical protein
MIDDATEPASNSMTTTPLTPQQKELFPKSDGIHPHPFSSPFINPDVTANPQAEEQDGTGTAGPTMFDLPSNDLLLNGQPVF